VTHQLLAAPDTGSCRQLPAEAAEPAPPGSKAPACRRFCCCFPNACIQLAPCTTPPFTPLALLPPCTLNAAAPPTPATTSSSASAPSERLRCLQSGRAAAADQRLSGVQAPPARQLSGPQRGPLPLFNMPCTVLISRAYEKQQTHVFMPLAAAAASSVCRATFRPCPRLSPSTHPFCDPTHLRGAPSPPPWV
jgi:hypothetical protein